MKILRIIYDWPPPWHGLAPHPYEVTASQAKEGHKVDVFCGRWPNAGKIEIINGVTLHPIIREPFAGMIFFTSSLVLFFQYLSFRRKNKDTEIIHSHGHFAVWIYLYRYILQKYFPWSKELKTPLVVHFHNNAKDRWLSMKKQNKQISLLAKYFIWPLSVLSDQLAINCSAANIFVSEENKRKAIELYKAHEERCFVVETGVNPKLFKTVNAEEKEKSRKDIGLDIYDKIVLNVGVMSERKNIGLLVEALKYLPDNFKLMLVGPGKDDYEETLSDTIKISGLSNRVIRVGYTPYPNAPVAYQTSDVFVLPSSWEGLPKVVMESLACGIPTIASGFKISQEIKGLYYLESLTAQHIANYILHVLEDPQPVDYQKVAQMYSWDSRVKEIDKIYEFAKKNYLL